MPSQFDTLKKIESLDELMKIPTGNEVVLMHRGINPSSSFTVHGNFQGTTGNFVDVSNYVTLPLEFKVDGYNPKNLLEFLRGLQDPKLT